MQRRVPCFLGPITQESLIAFSTGLFRVVFFETSGAGLRLRHSICSQRSHVWARYKSHRTSKERSCRRAA